MDTQKLFILKSHLNFVNESFLTKPMFRFCNSVWILFCALICDLFGFISRHIARLSAVYDFHERNSNSGVLCPQPDDQKSFKDSEVDGLIEKEYSDFSFGFQFQTGKDLNLSFAETESSVSKYQFMSAKDVSGLIQEPKAMSFTVGESFGCVINKELNFYNGMTKNNDLQEHDYVGSRNRGSDQFIDFKASDFEDGQKLISEAEFVDLNQTEDCSKSSCSEEDIKGQEEISCEVHKLSLPIDEGKQTFFEKLESFEEIISMRYSSSSDEDLSFKKYKLEDTDDEYIELEPHFHHSIDEFVKKNQVQELHELQCDHNKGTEPLEGSGNLEEDSPKEKSWDWESNEDDEVDILMEHRDLIEQMKMELKNSRTRALPTILEESETPKIAEDLKPLHIDEKFEHCDRMEEIHKFYKSYSDKMRKLDILNYQTLHAISFLHLKEPVKLISSHKSAVSAIKSLILPNFNPGKLRKIYADQTLKSMSELHRDLERVYVGQVCLSWEILRWQYGKAKELQEYNSQDCHSYNQVAGEFQQFQVLVQRFTEDEPFQGPRVQNYVKKRHIVLTLLQVPTIKDDCFKDKNGGGDEEEGAISIAMLREIIEESMQVFWEFLRADKDEASLSLKGFRGTKVDHNAADSELLMNIKSSLQKKEKRLKEMLRSGNCIVKKFQKHQGGRVKHDIFISQVELRLVSRVLNLSRLTTDQLVWCQSKLNRINFVNRRIFVEPSFLLFPMLDF